MYLRPWFGSFFLPKYTIRSVNSETVLNEHYCLKQQIRISETYHMNIQGIQFYTM